jgi:glycosyltransferase involved in cell wall biosynthesis
MSRLIVVTQQVDPAHPALAATVPKLRALAARVDELVVFADEAVPGALPENCRFVSYRAPTRFRRGLRFEAALARELSRGRPLAVLAHMCPIYAVLAAPLARPLRVPVLLWFTQWRATRLLRFADRVSNVVLTVDREASPLRSAKLRSIGHGIDPDELACREEPEGPLRALALGRTSRSKGLPTIVEAVRLAREAGVDVELELRGPSLTEDERRHRAELGAVEEPLPRAELPALFARTSVLVNNTRAGGLDKVVFEAGLSCVPVLAPGFAGLLDERLRFPQDDAAALARRLGELAALSGEERTAIGRELRERVLAAHTVDTWAEGVLAAARR